MFGRKKREREGNAALLHAEQMLELLSALQWIVILKSVFLKVY